MIPDRFYNDEGELVEDAAFFEWVHTLSVARIIATSGAREATKAVKGRTHDHHGPNPCPVCGGVKS